MRMDGKDPHYHSPQIQGQKDYMVGLSRDPVVHGYLSTYEAAMYEIGYDREASDDMEWLMPSPKEAKGGSS